jgi:hypothetical protein
MLLEKRIDNLIEAGWHVLASDFDPVAFDHWRAEASKCVRALLGPDHVDTRAFTEHVYNASTKRDPLLRRGIVTRTDQEALGRLHTAEETEEEH